MSTFTEKRLTFYQEFLKDNFGYSPKRFRDLVDPKKPPPDQDIVIFEFDENSVTHHNHKNMFAMSLYLLRIVSKIMFNCKPIDLKLTNLSNSFKGKVEINNIIILDCFTPKLKDFELIVDNKPISDDTETKPINLTIFSEVFVLFFLFITSTGFKTG